MADRFFHVDVQFGHKRTCERLLDRFGHAGPLVFLLVLAEAKKSNPAGTFTYESEEGAWRTLGLMSHRPDFTIDEFFTVLGQYKQTRKTRSGRITNVILTQWGRWQKDWERERVRKTMRRKRAVSDRNNGVTMPSQRSNTCGTETEIEIETPLPPSVTDQDQDLNTVPTEENLRAVRELAAQIGLKINADPRDEAAEQRRVNLEVELEPILDEAFSDPIIAVVAVEHTTLGAAQ